MSKTLLVSLTLISLVLFITFSNGFSGLKHSKNLQKQIQKQTFNQQCNMTHFQFTDFSSISKNTILNRTLSKIGDRIQSLNNVTWKKSSYLTYRIFDAKPIILYTNNEKQITEIIGNDTILFQGGNAEVTINFQWQKIDQNQNYKNGTGKAKGLSQKIIFATFLELNSQNVKTGLLDYANITFNDNFNLENISPDASQDEKQDIFHLVNSIINKGLKYQIEDQINIVFSYYLRMNIYEVNDSLDINFYYQWKSPVSSKGQLIINFVRRVTSFDVQKTGISYGYEARIDNWYNNKCGVMLPTNPHNISFYGGRQQFISYAFYENVLRYAIQNRQIDTQLNDQLWGTNLFLFYAGNLFEVLPSLINLYQPEQVISGKCLTNPTQVKVYKGSQNTFNISIFSNCQLSINEHVFLQFVIELQLEVQGRAKQDYLEFILKSHTGKTKYNDNFGFKLENKPLADSIVKKSLLRLYQDRLFGSGWMLYAKRDNPSFIFEDNDTFIYDSPVSRKQTE